jgi:hypothetical protein
MGTHFVCELAGRQQHNSIAGKSSKVKVGEGRNIWPRYPENLRWAILKGLYNPGNFAAGSLPNMKVKLRLTVIVDIEHRQPPATEL